MILAKFSAPIEGTRNSRACLQRKGSQNGRSEIRKRRREKDTKIIVKPFASAADVQLSHKLGSVVFRISDRHKMQLAGVAA